MNNTQTTSINELDKLFSTEKENYFFEGNGLKHEGGFIKRFTLHTVRQTTEYGELDERGEIVLGKNPPSTYRETFIWVAEKADGKLIRGKTRTGQVRHFSTRAAAKRDFANYVKNQERHIEQNSPNSNSSTIYKKRIRIKKG